MSAPLLHKPSAVVTTPPWAKDEPPSPNPAHSLSVDRHSLSHHRRATDNASCISNSGGHWWTFNLPRPGTTTNIDQSVSTPRNVKNRSMSWLTSPAVLRDVAAFSRKDKQRITEGGPTPPRVGLNLVHPARPGLQRDHLEESLYDDYGDIRNQDPDPAMKKKRFRYFILVNPYVPLLFRLINIALTSAALGIATHIRRIEINNHLLGIMGSSPTVVIIFAPLTLVHVAVAIYLEYFGRPVGLWKTSAKLIHMLSETAFICAWSAALSLCFDNYFTSLIPCASSSRISWYNQLPRPQSALLPFEKSIGHHICVDQVTLIGLVLFGLLTYCINLIISLFRIFEKVKYQTANVQLALVT